MSNIEIGPYQDHQRRTCIVIGHSKSSVELILLDTTSGLKVSEMQEKSFVKDYKKIEGYPLHKAIEQYIEFAVYSGMTDQVKEIFRDMLTSPANGVDTSLALVKLDAVRELVVGTKHNKVSKATKRQADSDDNPPWEDEPPSNKDSKKTKQTTGKIQSKERDKTREKDTKLRESTKEVKKTMATGRTTKVDAPATQKNSDGVKVRKQTAAQMFRELILSNSYDDETIFKMVQKEYGLDDKKRSYVAYYRRELQQKGLL